MFKEINDSLKKINKKIVIFIDDLDRLDKEEVVEVIRLIRNTANFHNTFFVGPMIKIMLQPLSKITILIIMKGS